MHNIDSLYNILYCQKEIMAKCFSMDNFSFVFYFFRIVCHRYGNLCDNAIRNNFDNTVFYNIGLYLMQKIYKN